MNLLTYFLRISNARTSGFPAHFILDSVCGGLDSLMLEIRGIQIRCILDSVLGVSPDFRLALKGRDGWRFLGIFTVTPTFTALAKIQVMLLTCLIDVVSYLPQVLSIRNFLTHYLDSEMAFNGSRLEEELVHTALGMLCSRAAFGISADAIRIILGGSSPSQVFDGFKASKYCFRHNRRFKHETTFIGSGRSSKGS